MKQLHMASSPHDVDSDVKRKGYLLKVKTSKKKYFVLREESSSGPARLEYYDSKKKYHTGGMPRRTILLNQCFSINAKSDGSRHRHKIVLYTKDDCFAVACETETEQRDWLNTMTQLRSASLDSSSNSRTLFRHVWQVCVETVDGKTVLIKPGNYRLCLTATNISLVPLGSTKSEIVIPLCSVRCCGHGDSLFLLEVDQSAMVDAGELWLRTDNAAVARSIHDTFVTLLESSCVTSTQTGSEIRPRASTFVPQSTTSSGIYLPEVRRAAAAVARRRQTVRSTASTVSPSVSDSVWSPALEKLIKEGHSSETNYFVMKPPGLQANCSAECDSGYIEMRRPNCFIGYVDMTCGRLTVDNHRSGPSRSFRYGKGGYIDMIPRVESSSALPSDPTQSLAGRLEVVRSYVHDESSGDNSDDSSIDSHTGSDEQLPKERAYSVGCRPPVMARLHLRSKTPGSTIPAGSRPPKAPEKSAGKSGAEAVGTANKSAAELTKKLSEEKIVESSTTDMMSDTTTSSNFTADKAADSEMRPRTFTFPWDLLRQKSSGTDALRPRSSSGGNTAGIREVLKSRLASGRQLSSSAKIPSEIPGRVDVNVRRCTPHLELVSSADAEDKSDYVEMHCPAAS